MNGIAVKAANAVSQFVQHEVSDYSHFDDFTIGEIEEYEGRYDVEIDFPKAEKTVHFRASKVEDAEELDDVQLEVCMYEDVYEEVTRYGWQVKYFWIALLGIS